MLKKYLIPILYSLSLSLFAEDGAKVQIRNELKPQKKVTEKGEKKSSIYDAIYRHSKLMPSKHIHGPSCEHNIYKTE